MNRTSWQIVPFKAIYNESAFGPRFSGDLYTQEGNVATLRTTDLDETGRISYSTMPLALVDEDKFKHHFLRPGDLVITRSGRCGTAAVFRGYRLPVLPGAFLLRYRLSAQAEPRFYCYYFNSPHGREQLLARATGTVQQNLNITNLETVQVPFPSLCEQRAIARILGTLDDKIELNRRMNDTLESMARALFKSWFVDFDPVRAKAEGRQPAGMDAETAALFPATFQESELGHIPTGWETAEIRQRAATIQYGFTQSSTTEPVGPRFLRITDIQGGRVDWNAVPFCVADEGEHARYRICVGDIFVARTGASTGESIYIVEAPDAVFASYLVRIQFRDAGLARIVGEYMRTSDYFEYVVGAIGGSAQPNASAQVLAGAVLVFPTPSVTRAFYDLVHPWDMLRAANTKQASTLAALRDTLLPKLLSGELRIRDAENMIEAHV